MQSIEQPGQQVALLRAYLLDPRTHRQQLVSLGAVDVAAPLSRNFLAGLHDLHHPV